MALKGPCDEQAVSRARSTSTSRTRCPTGSRTHSRCPPEDAPNVLYIVLDDVGFSAMESFGGLIETPNIKRIADRGLLYTNFHTTALCSPTRSCLLTGRNHTTNSMACITEAVVGLPERERPHPWRVRDDPARCSASAAGTPTSSASGTSAPEDEMNMASTKKDWPLGRGFERFYGFLGAETNQWYPDLIYDNHPVEQPTLPEEGYHFSVDITDKALSFIKDAKVVAPDKPFFLYYCLRRRARAAPRAEGVGGQVQGQVRHGLRGLPRARLREPEEARDRPRPRRALADQPLHRPDEARAGRRGARSTSCARGTRSPTTRRQLFSRMAEVYAGFLSHADDQLGRVLDYLEKSGQLDNTLIVLVSDNGASGEGGPNGSVNENKIFNGLPDTIEETLKYARRPRQPEDVQPLSDRLGVGLQHAVQDVEALRELPGRHGRPDDRLLAGPDQRRRASATQYTHAVDIAPTIYELLGVELPEVVNGFTQHPLEGESFAASLHDADAKGKQTQFYSMLGTRGDLPRRLEGRVGDAGRTRTPGATSPTSAGSSSTPRPTRASATTSPSEQPGEAAGAGRALVGRGRQVRCPAARVPRRARASSSRRGRSSRSRATATSTTRTAPRCPSRSPRTSATAPTRSRSS